MYPHTDQKSPSAIGRPFVVLALALALIGAACGVTGARGSGEALVEQLDLDLTDVDSVAAADIWNVEVVVGEVAGVEIRIDDNLRDRIDVKVDGDRLDFELRSGILNPKIGFNAVVTLPSVTHVEAADSSEIVGSGFGRNELVVSGSDSAKITLSGDLDAAEIEATDASKVDLSDLRLVDATIKASDAARLEVVASGSVSGKATDAARVTVSGGASVDVRTEDAASLRSN